ncbi:MAG TPA: TonB-dependent receptor [Gemmatimonadales bacterium]|jgi:iron complex outermembrane receptor protein|nr:TonB-dependent receptor [Gemmatimonadales bacterium]
MYALLTALALSLHAPAPQTVSGTVTDTSGAPLTDARVTLIELARATTTDPEGRFSFTNVAPGAYRLSVSAIGFAPVIQRVTVGDSAVSLQIRLKPSVVELTELQVTASPNATTLLDSPQPASALSGNELLVRQSPSLGETVQSLPGVRSLSTGTGIGKPVIRGLTSNRVLVVVDGQRLETQQWGDEHGPNVETEEADRIEVIRGPASVLYGSDALGGVVNVVPKDLPDAIGRPGFVRGRLTTAYSTNNEQPDGSLLLQGAEGGFGFRAALTGRTSNDIDTPVGPLFNSGNRAVGGTGAVGYRGGWGSVAATYTHRDEKIEIHEDPAEDPTATPFQRIDEDRAKVSTTLPVGAARLEGDLAFERNRRREFEEAGTEEVALGLLSKTYTANLHYHHVAFGPWAGVFGASGLINSFDKFGAETLIPNSTGKSVGVYGFEQADYGRWNFSLGARFDYRVLDVDADEELGVVEQQRTYNSVTGNIGALYHLSESTALVFNAGRGFRAPSSFELFANGVHEGTIAFERGDSTLQNEHSINTDLAFRVQTAKIRAELGAFANFIQNFIYSQPTAEVDPESGFQIFDVTQGDARLVGFEGAVQYHPTAFLHFDVTADYTRGENTTTDTPLPSIPPFRAIYSVRLERERLGSLIGTYLSMGGESNAKQTRLDPSEAAFFGESGYQSEGYTIVNFGAGFGVPVGSTSIRLDLSLRNAFDKQFTNFLSRYKTYALDPGRNLTIRATTDF